jgi:hydroxymethylglutaryl-CoA synthase
MDEGYGAVVKAGVSAVMKKLDLTPADVAHVALSAPNARPRSAMAQRLGFDEKTQVQDVLHLGVGDTGSALSLMSLVQVLERAKAGDKILLASYGSGCDVAVLEATSKIGSLKDRCGIQKSLEAKAMLPGYMKYLRWRELVTVQPPARPASYRHQMHQVRHTAVPAATRVRGVSRQRPDGAA